jgi:hypothetical protein
MQLPYTTTLKFSSFGVIVMTVIFNLSFCNKESDQESPPIPGNGITVLTPNGNETYYIGDTIKITWNLADTSMVGLQFDFSSNGGANYANTPISLIQHDFQEFQNREISWIIPDSILITASVMCQTSCSPFLQNNHHGLIFYSLSSFDSCDVIMFYSSHFSDDISRRD